VLRLSPENPRVNSSILFLGTSLRSQNSKNVKQNLLNDFESDRRDGLSSRTTEFYQTCYRLPHLFNAFFLLSNGERLFPVYKALSVSLDVALKSLFNIRC
jgi:hypothetical protein